MSGGKISITLDIANVEVLSVTVSERGYEIGVESTLDGTHCQRCGRKIKAFHGYNEPVEVRHLPILGQAVYITYRPKRYACPYCAGKPTTTQQVTWHTAGSSMTKAYERSVLKALIHSTVQDVSQKEALSYDSVLGVMERCVADQVVWSRFQRLDVLGIDELAVKKGQRDYVVIVTTRNAVGELALLGVLPNREQATVQAFLDSIPPDLKATIHSVCVDMYVPYHQAIHAALPHAAIVIDRFHVVKHYMHAADAVRQQVMKDLKKKLPKADYAALKGVHLAFRQHWTDLSSADQRLLDLLFHHAPRLVLVYDFREALFRLFEKPSAPAQAADDLKIWMFLVREQRIPGFDAFIDTLQNHWDGILNFFARRLTSGFVEGLNTKIRVLTRRSFGLFNLHHFFQRLWLDLEGYRTLA